MANIEQQLEKNIQKLKDLIANKLTDENLRKVELAFGYTFKNKNLLRQAFLKDSLQLNTYEPNSQARVYEYVSHIINNDSLEFIGDRILYTVITNLYFQIFRKATTEGFIHLPTASKMSKFDSKYTSNKYWENIINLKKNTFIKKLIIVLNDNALKNGHKVLADLFEAIFGAIAIDSDFNINKLCKSFLYIRFRPNKNGLLNRCKFEEFIKDKKNIEYLIYQLPNFIYQIDNAKAFS